MKFILAFGVLLISACTPVPEVRLTAEERDMCLRDADPKGDVVMMSAYGEGCLEYGAAKRMMGVWYNGFEESGFVKGARHAPPLRDLETDEIPEYDTQLTFVDDAELTKITLPDRRPGCVRAMHLVFDGRKAVRRYPKPMQRDVAVIRVDRVISSKFVGYVSTTIAGKPYLCPSS